MITTKVVIVLLSSVAVLLFVQTVATNLATKKEDTSLQEKKEVQSAQTTLPTASPTNSPQPTIAQKISKLSPTPFPSQTPVQSGQTTKSATVILNNFIYANSTTVEQDDTHVSLQTFEPVHAVFQWYEKKIDELNGRAKAIVKTEVNDEFLAKLRATVKNDIVNIEIRKKAEQKVVFIVITISPS